MTKSEKYSLRFRSTSISVLIAYGCHRPCPTGDEFLTTLRFFVIAQNLHFLAAGFFSVDAFPAQYRIVPRKPVSLCKVIVLGWEFDLHQEPCCHAYWLVALVQVRYPFALAVAIVTSCRYGIEACRSSAKPVMQPYRSRSASFRADNKEWTATTGNDELALIFLGSRSGCRFHSSSNLNFRMSKKLVGPLVGSGFVPIPNSSPMNGL